MTATHAPATRAATNRALRGEAGSALLVATAVAAIVMLLATTVVTLAVRSEAAAARDRSRTQALAAAEAGLDEALLQVRGLDSTRPQDFPCSTSIPIWSAPESYTVVADFTYLPASGAVGVCPPTTGSGLARVDVTATATRNAGVPAQRAMTASVVLRASRPDPAATFDEALFSDGYVQTSGELSTSGNVYTNGSYACAGPSVISGSLTAHGSVQTTGSCRVEGDVHAGSLACSQAVVGGDLHVVGTGQTQASGCRVAGDVAVGGSFAFSGATWVGGSLTSAGTASSVVGAQARVHGAARLRGAVVGASSTTFPGGVTPNASPAPAAPVVPPRQDIPVLQHVPADWSTSTTLTPQQWFATSGAPYSSSCGFIGSAGTPLRATAASTVVNATACFPLSLSGATFALRGDLTIFARGFAVSGLRVTSTDGQPHTLRIIVPARSTTSVCATGGGSLDASGTWTVESPIRTFVYTPGAVRLSGPVSLTGAVYTCGAQFSGDITVDHDSASLPPVSGPASSIYAASPPTKADVS